MHGVNVTMVSDRGMVLMCEHGDAPATSAWTDTLGRQHLACDAHAVRFTGTAVQPGCQCPETLT